MSFLLSWLSFVLLIEPTPVQPVTSEVPAVFGLNLTAYHLVVDVTNNVEYLYQGGELIETHLVSTGCRDCFEIAYYTPLGTWRISREVDTLDDSQYGPYFLGLDKWEDGKWIRTSIGLHGTNEPDKLGQDASHGCVRHDNYLIRRYQKLLPIGTIVETVDNANSYQLAR